MTHAQRLGRYRIGERLGQGGVAEVFRAEVDGAEGFSRSFAIKRVRDAVASNPGVIDGFLAEAAMARRLSHGNIVQIHDVGVEDGLPYLVMEHVDGPSLAEILQLRGTLSVTDALYVIEQVSAALDYAHRLTDEAGRPAGIVHRDVHPRNILVSRDGVVKLTDFGIARSLHAPARTVPGLIKGTLGYLSPEQIRGDDITAAADLFATGVVLYEMLGGSNPLIGSSDLDEYRHRLSAGLPPLIHAVRAGGPTRSAGTASPSSASGTSDPTPSAIIDPGIDDELSAIVARATALTPRERFRSLGDLQAELERWRVTRRLRPSPERLRRVVRSALGTRRTAAVRSLDGALAARLDAAPVARTRVSPTADPVPRSLPGWKVLKWLVPPALAVVAGLISYLVLHDSAENNPNPVAEPVVAARADAGLDRTAPAPPDRMPDRVPDQVPDGAIDAAPVPAHGAAPDAAPVPAHGTAPDAAPDTTTRKPRKPRRRSGSDSARPAKRTGRLKVNLLPWAQVQIDGENVGRTPVNVALSPGPHRVELENPDTGQRSRRELEIRSGETITITRW